LLLAACAPKAPNANSEVLAVGERAYQKCYSCHALEPGKNDLTGPTLHRIVGRSVAAEPGYDYSPALRRLSESEPRWTRELLDRFVEDPERLVPGTSMTFHGIRDPAERAALIAFLDQRQTSASAASLP
jgi:cytochrome c